MSLIKKWEKLGKEKEKKKRQKLARFSRLKEKKQNQLFFINMQVDSIDKRLKKKFFGEKYKPMIKEIKKNFFLKVKKFRKKGK